MRQHPRVALFFALTAAALSSCSSGGNIPTGKNTAVLQVKMDNTPAAAGHHVEVYVDDIELGTVKNGGAASFNFVARSGVSEVKLRWPKNDSNPIESSDFRNFQLAPGEVLVVRGHLSDPGRGPGKLGGFTSMPPLICHVERQGVSILSMSPPAIPEISNVVVEETCKRVQAGEPAEVISIAGVEQKIRKSRTLDQTVDFSQANVENREWGFNLQVASAKATAQVEKRQGCQLRKSETHEREVTIQGNQGGKKYKLVWYDVVRKGSVTAQIGHASKTLSFQYKESTDLTVELVGP